MYSKAKQIRDLHKRLAITDGGSLVDEVCQYKDMAVVIGLERTGFKGKLADIIVNRKETNELN